jgi:hypothetical protein
VEICAGRAVPRSIDRDPGANGDATIYSDDGHAYNYESGQYRVASVHYDDKTRAVQVSGGNSLLPADLHPHIVETK